MSEAAPPSSPRREPVRVEASRPFAWYAEAMRLFRARPLGFVALAVAVLAAEIVTSAIPVAGRALATMIVPLVACGLLYACLAVDRGDRPRASHLVAPFTVAFPALAAVLLSGVVVFAAEWIVAWQLEGVDLLASPSAGEPAPSAATTLIVYAVGVAVSLPLTLVPLHALFEDAGVGESFARSARAFSRNLPAFALYGLLSYLLLGFAVVTLGVGLLVALPLWAGSAYAAWKELWALGG